MLTIREETAARLEKKDGRAIKAFGLGSTDQGLRLIQSYFEDYLKVIESKTKEAKYLKGRKKELLSIDPEELTLACLLAGFSAIGGHGNNTRTEPELIFSNTLRYLGVSMERMCYGNALRVWNKKEADNLEQQLKRASTLAYRERILKRKAKEKGFVYADWQDTDRLQVGGWVLEWLLDGDLFSLDKDNQLTITEEALDRLSVIMEALLHAGSFLRPVTEKPDDWTSTAIHVEGFKHMLVRSHSKAIQSLVGREIKSGRMSPALEALNHAQSVPWAINEPILDLVTYCYRNDIRGLGLPPLKSTPLPVLNEAWENLTADQQRLWMQEQSQIKTLNRGYIGERIIMERDLAMAESLRGKPFWTHTNFDYRGRVYGMPHFNFQRYDPIRAMFQFHKGEVLTEEGLYWLKVHVANCGAFSKIDKAPFDERVKWVDDNYDDLLNVGLWPEKMISWWKEADSPFMFVAACQSLLRASDGLPVHIPVSFDGSCSGLQHLCMMANAEEGTLVNLTPSDKPQDVYEEVAKKVRERIEADTENPLLAKLWLSYGITRSTVKRNVMTYSYSSKKPGMTDQCMADIMRPLATRVTKGELSEHPFGEHEWEAARYFASHTYEAIEEVVKRPAEVMRFLMSVSRCYSHEGKPTVWHTPLGFPVMLRYMVNDSKQIKLFLHDRGIKRRVGIRSSIETAKINKKKAANGIAPSFVHSLDACHLMMVVKACKENGIDEVALVHDSFGCLPNQAPKFRSLILETFRKLYEQHDVLAEFRKEAEAVLETTKERLPQVPPKGNLDLSLIEQSRYAFA